MSRLFVGNIPYTVDADALKAHIFALGIDVDECIIIKDRETQRSRGFGFVTTPMSLPEAIEALDGQEVEGRRLAVREAHRRSPRLGDHGPQHADHGDSGRDGRRKKKKRRDRDHDRW